MKIVEVTCRYSSQAFNVRHGGQSASSTSSSETAVHRLAEKLWGKKVKTITLLGHGDDLYSDRWRIEVDERPTAVESQETSIHDYFAFCWSTGLIQFGSSVPEGAIEICRGRRTTVVREVTVGARHSYSGGLLVPGVPEAVGQRLKAECLGVWLAWRAGDNKSKHITWSHLDAEGKFRDPAEVDRVAKALLRQMLKSTTRAEATQ